MVPAAIRFIALPQFAPYFIAGGALYLIGRTERVTLAYGLWAGAVALMCIKTGQRIPPLFPTTGVSWSEHPFTITLLGLVLFLIVSYAVVQFIEQTLAPRIRRGLSAAARRTAGLVEGRSHG